MKSMLGKLRSSAHLTALLVLALVLGSNVKAHASWLDDVSACSAQYNPWNCAPGYDGQCVYDNYNSFFNCIAGIGVPSQAQMDFCDQARSVAAHCDAEHAACDGVPGCLEEYMACRSHSQIDQCQ